MTNVKNIQPTASFYDLSVNLNTGETLSFSALKGKKVLLVNTASDCGYTPQYADLQSLHEAQKDQLVILGFPANDFGEQEKGTDAEIAGFCQRNFGVSFPLVNKSTVIKGASQHPVFQWLTNPALNGWNDQPPVWNFSKYLVSEEGVLLQYFEPSVSPSGPEIANALKKG